MRAWFRVLLLVLGVATMPPARAAWNLPPLEGECSGELTPVWIPGAPPLHWRATMAKGAGEARHVVVTAEGKGTRFRVEGDLDPASGDGTWRIADCVLDAASWLPALALRADGLLVTAKGQLSIVGSGVLREGVPSGSLEVSWSGGALDDSGGTWKLEGLTAEGGFDFDAATGALRNSRPATLNVRTITTNRFGARNLSLQFELKGLTTLELKTGHVEIAGGEVTAAPCTIALQPFAAMFDLRVHRIGLQDVAALVPGTVAEAHGRIDGDVQLGWSAADGFKLGTGRLSVRHDEPAEVRLEPSPGLITNSLPPATRKKVLKYYPGLEKIERGELPIRAQELTVTFTPNGDAEGRTATVHLAGGPVDPNMRAPVDLQVNVRGPLQWLIKLGTSPRLHFGAGK